MSSRRPLVAAYFFRLLEGGGRAPQTHVHQHGLLKIATVKGTRERPSSARLPARLRLVPYECLSTDLRAKQTLSFVPTTPAPVLPMLPASTSRFKSPVVCHGD